MDGITLGLLALGLFAVAILVSRLLPRPNHVGAIPPSPQPPNSPPAEAPPPRQILREVEKPLSLPKLPDLPAPSERELERLVRSIRGDVRTPKQRPTRRRPVRTPGSNTRSLGGVSYFVVDDEGRPQQQ